MQLWTQRAAVSFRRSLSFFERRFEILRELENNDELQGFRVGEERVSARIGDPNHRVTLSSNSIDAAVLHPDGDIGRIRRAIDLIVQRLELESLVRPVFAFQWLAELESEYEEARRAAAMAFFRDAKLGFTDFAILADGRTPDPDAAYGVEFGILEAAEVPARLARQVTMIEPIAPDSPNLWSSETVPSVSFYSHSVWRVESAAESAPDGFFHLWEGTQKASQTVMSELMRHAGLNE